MSKKSTVVNTVNEFDIETMKQEIDREADARFKMVNMTLFGACAGLSPDERERYIEMADIVFDTEEEEDLDSWWDSVIALDTTTD